MRVLMATGHDELIAAVRAGLVKVGTAKRLVYALPREEWSGALAAIHRARERGERPDLPPIAQGAGRGRYTRRRVPQPPVVTRSAEPVPEPVPGPVVEPVVEPTPQRRVRDRGELARAVDGPTGTRRNLNYSQNRFGHVTHLVIMTLTQQLDALRVVLDGSAGLDPDITPAAAKQMLSQLSAGRRNVGSVIGLLKERASQ
jgi:hypothetical protein